MVYAVITRILIFCLPIVMLYNTSCNAMSGTDVLSLLHHLGVYNFMSNYCTVIDQIKSYF